MTSGFIAILRKDLRTEMRSGQSTVAIVVIATMILVALVLAFNPSGARGRELAAGSLWMALLFAGVLGSGGALKAELENDCLLGLRISPVDLTTVYAAKLTAVFIFMTIAEIAGVCLLILFFNLNFGSEIQGLAIVLVLGTIGYAALATLLAAIAMQIRTGDLLMPLLLVPVFVPALIAGVKATGIVLDSGSLGASAQWLKILCAFDVLFVTSGYLLFQHVIRED